MDLASIIAVRDFGRDFPRNFHVFRRRNYRSHNGIPMPWRFGSTKWILERSKKVFAVGFRRWPRMRFAWSHLDNDIDGPTLLKLSESMVVRLLPTIKLEVQFLDLLQTLRQRHATEQNSKKTLPSSSSHTNGHRTSIVHPTATATATAAAAAAVAAAAAAAHLMASSSSAENGLDRSSNSNSPVPPTPTNGHHHPRMSNVERSQIHSQRSTPKAGPPLKNLKREPKYFPSPSLKWIVRRSCSIDFLLFSS